MIKLIPANELEEPLESTRVVESSNHNWYGFVDGLGGYPIIINVTPTGELIENPCKFKDELIEFSKEFLDAIKLEQIEDAIKETPYESNYIRRPTKHTAWTVTFTNAAVTVIRPDVENAEDIAIEADVHQCVHAAQHVLKLVAETSETEKLSKEFLAMLAGRYYSIVYQIKQHLHVMMKELITGKADDKGE